ACPPPRGSRGSHHKRAAHALSKGRICPWKPLARKLVIRLVRSPRLRPGGRRASPSRISASQTAEVNTVSGAWRRRKRRGGPLLRSHWYRAGSPVVFGVDKFRRRA